MKINSYIPDMEQVFTQAMYKTFDQTWYYSSSRYVTVALKKQITISTKNKISYKHSIDEYISKTEGKGYNNWTQLIC